MRWIATLGLTALISLAGCTEEDTPPSGGFYGRLEAGANCPELFEIRNELDPKDPDIPEMNDRLREIGCYSASSERTD